MDWENFVGYAMMVVIAVLMLVFCWAFIIGLCVVADFFGLY